MKEGGRKINLERLLGSGEGAFEAGSYDFVVMLVCSFVISTVLVLKEKRGKEPTFREEKRLTF